MSKKFRADEFVLHSKRLADKGLSRARSHGRWGGRAGHTQSLPTPCVSRERGRTERVCL